MKLESYVESIDEVVALANTADPSLAVEDRAYERRKREAQADIENNSRIVADGNIKDHVLYKLGFMAGLKWRDQLRAECLNKLKKPDKQPQTT